MGRRWVYIYSIRRNIYWFFALIQCMTQSVCMLSLRSILIWLIGCLISVTWLYTNFLCDRPLPEPHDMLDPTLKVSVNYNRERERGKREERRERKRRERKRVHPFSHLFDTGAWGKKECWVSSEKNPWMEASTDKMGGKLYF